jgi:hypothetical protein
MSSRCRTLQRAPTRVASNIEEGGPDYDWEARMEGKPSGDGDDEANHFFVVGNAWLVDNRQGLLTTENMETTRTSRQIDRPNSCRLK